MCVVVQERVEGKQLHMEAMLSTWSDEVILPIQQKSGRKQKKNNNNNNNKEKPVATPLALTESIKIIK